MEENGFSTVILTPAPEFNNAVGVPRSAAIEYPFGRVVGQMNDREGQKQVLRETLILLEQIKTPGEIRHLPFTWLEDPKDTDWHPPEISPIVKINLDQIKKMQIK